MSIYRTADKCYFQLENTNHYEAEEIVNVNCVTFAAVVQLPYLLTEFKNHRLYGVVLWHFFWSWCQIAGIKEATPLPSGVIVQGAAK